MNVRKKVKCSIVSSSGDNDKRGHLNSKNADKGVLNGDFKNKIFEKFYTVNHSVVDSKKSMGLGLSLCKSIVEAHGGVISVKDNQPTGAIFTFSLPATKITINKNMVNC